MIHYPRHLVKLIALLKNIPGVGTKSAERFAFQLMEWPPEALQEIAQTLQEIPHALVRCAECGGVGEGACPLCTDAKRNPKLLCVVASYKEIFSIEKTRAFSGLYHVLGTLLSPIQGRTPPPESISKLKERIVRLGVEEVIASFDPTLEGDATFLYLKKVLSSLPITLSRPALGLPMGSSLDTIDEGTLGRALAGRRPG